MFSREPFVFQYVPSSRLFTRNSEDAYRVIAEKLEMTNDSAVKDEAPQSPIEVRDARTARLRSFCASQTKPLDP
jgi:hypothetical protein